MLVAKQAKICFLHLPSMTCRYDRGDAYRPRRCMPYELWEITREATHPLCGRTDYVAEYYPTMSTEELPLP